MTDTDPTLGELNAIIARYPDPADKLNIALGNFNRVRAERDELRKVIRASAGADEDVQQLGRDARGGGMTDNPAEGGNRMRDPNQPLPPIPDEYYPDDAETLRYALSESWSWRWPIIGNIRRWLLKPGSERWARRMAADIEVSEAKTRRRRALEDCWRDE